MDQPMTSIKRLGGRRRRLAGAILKRHEQHFRSTNPIEPPPDSIRVVCISDTHNKRPIIPPGDILIHAGDLTENGSFDEVQAGILWLSSQPHRFKIFVAGNHDVLLDDKFLKSYPKRRYGQTKTKDELDWGEVIYLQDSSVTIDVPVSHTDNEPDATTTSTHRRITIYGSPWTPRYGISAFQYPPDEAETYWSSRLSNLPKNDLILITHGPPKLYLDRRDFHQAGCPHLLPEIYNLRPRLHIFGHIHAAYGVLPDVAMDSVREAHDDVVIGWVGGLLADIWTIVCMVVLVVWGR